MNDEMMRFITDHVEKEARLKGVRVHPSALIELDNYSRHEGVRDLAESQLRTVLVGIADQAIELEGEPVLHAGAVRSLLRRLCSDPFSPCRSAAMRILGLEEDEEFDVLGE